MRTTPDRLMLVSSTEGRQWRRRTVARGMPRGGSELLVTGEEKQRWRGFGGCFNELGWIALSGLPSRLRKAALDALFHPATGCAFNLCRLPIGASDYALDWYSHDETPGDYSLRRFSIERDRRCLIPYIREGLKRRPDMELFASPWSPPTWMKNPPVYNYGTLVWEDRVLRAYAMYFARFVREYLREGIRISQVHVQNEPLADQKFPSCLWSGEKLRDFIRDYLGPCFRKEKTECEIWLGTLNTDDHYGYAHRVLSDPAAASFIRGVGYQWAGKGAIQRTRMAWPDIPLMQTENECGDGRNTWDYAMYVFSLMQHYITNGVAAYVYWNMVLPPGGRSTWGWSQNAMITADAERGRIVLNPEFYVMKHLSAFVKPGAAVLRLEGPWSAMSVGFRNPDGSLVVGIGNMLCDRQVLHLEWEGGGAELDLDPKSVNTVVLG